MSKCFNVFQFPVLYLKQNSKQNQKSKMSAYHSLKKKTLFDYNNGYIVFELYIFYNTQIIENLNQSLETYSVWMEGQFRFDLGQERLYQTAYLPLDQ